MSHSSQLSRLVQSGLDNNVALQTHRQRVHSFSEESLIFGNVTKLKNVKKLLVANRGEIAIRIMRAASELGLPTVGIYSKEDEFGLHRFRADESFLVGQGNSPLRAYLNIPDIIRICEETGSNAIHPGYGFLSENADLVKACEANNIIFVGPSLAAIEGLGDKVAARSVATQAGVPIVPGTDGPVSSVEEAAKFCASSGFPVLIKAAFGGGGRGMRVVRQMSELASSFDSAVREAEGAFGNGCVFIEKYILSPRHIEVQVMGDKHGNIVHLFERDCSIQRRHQKVIEMTPAQNLSQECKNAMYADAIKISKFLNYSNAGTVEFLFDGVDKKHYFIEVNPRLQVEHTVTEECTGVDIVKAQICIADGYPLNDLCLFQDELSQTGVAIQVRVTTEDPKEDFKPDTGRLQVYRHSGGPGIRLDSATTVGSIISPHYDSLLVKLTARANTFQECIRRLNMAITEFRIRGVKTNMGFLQKVLKHPSFVAGTCTTTFIDETPSLMTYSSGMDATTRLLYFLSDLVVNGSGVSPHLYPDKSINPIVPPTPDGNLPSGWRDVLIAKGPEAFAKAVRDHPQALITDTTWRDAHQSLLATRVRTVDLVNIAPVSAHYLSKCFSLESWGGATFDVCLRFLHECPWDRLVRLRQMVPNIPFQMLLRGANAVGYTSYPDNVVDSFVQKAKDVGVDIFRVFDSLNYIPNLAVGISAIHKAGGVVEATICYTGDVSDPQCQYNIAYYLKKVTQLVELKIHILAIKDMAGLLKPRAATFLVNAIREKFPNLVIHVHTHDTAGTGVATLIAAIEAGADIIDCATDCLSGMTSQPSIGAVVNSLAGSKYATELEPLLLTELNDYWEETRKLYKPFESPDLRSGNSDVYQHEMPGGQYTNLQFQAASLGLHGRWPAIKKAYAAANRLCGNIVKVTPSSKVVGDFAQFMVANNLTETQVTESASTLDFPQSVVSFFQGNLGQPENGFPSALRKAIIKDLPQINDRPGAGMAPFDFDLAATELRSAFKDVEVTDGDILSYSLYPEVTRGFLKFRHKYGNLSWLPTRLFFRPMEIDDEIEIIETPFFKTKTDKDFNVKLMAVGRLTDGNREVFWEVNGRAQLVAVADTNVSDADASSFKAKATDAPGSVGAPMAALVVEFRVEVGQKVSSGDPLLVLSAMKMEMVITSPIDGVVDTIHVGSLENVAGGDLLITVLP